MHCRLLEVGLYARHAGIGDKPRPTQTQFIGTAAKLPSEATGSRIAASGSPPKRTGNFRAGCANEHGMRKPPIARLARIPGITQTEFVSNTGETKSKRVPPAPTAVAAHPFDITLDASRNLLHIRFRGSVTAAAMAAYVGQVESLLSQLRPGFTILTDLSRLDSMELDCVRPLTKVMDLCRIRGVGTVVRVIPDPTKDIGFNILALTHYRRDVHIVTCATLAEAELAITA